MSDWQYLALNKPVEQATVVGLSSSDGGVSGASEGGLLLFNVVGASLFLFFLVPKMVIVLGDS